MRLDFEPLESLFCYRLFEDTCEESQRGLDQADLTCHSCLAPQLITTPSQYLNLLYRACCGDRQAYESGGFVWQCRTRSAAFGLSSLIPTTWGATGPLQPTSRTRNQPTSSDSGRRSSKTCGPEERSCHPVESRDASGESGVELGKVSLGIQ